MVLKVLIFWRLRDLGLGRRGRGRLDAAAAGAGRDRRRAAGFTRGGSGAGRAGMPSSGHRRPPWRRAATAIGGAAMVMGAAGGAVRQRRCEPRGRESRAGSGLRRGVLAISSVASGVARRQASSGRGYSPPPAPVPAGGRLPSPRLLAGYRHPARPLLRRGRLGGAHLAGVQNMLSQAGRVRAASLLAACSLLAHRHQGAGEIPLKTQSINSAACAA